jgi:hypothetical protein
MTPAAIFVVVLSSGPALRLVDREAAVDSGPVGLRGQFLVQRLQFVFEVEVKVGHAGPESLALAGLLGGTQEGLEGDDVFPQVAVALRPWPPLLLSQPPTSLPISSIAFVAKP